MFDFEIVQPIPEHAELIMYWRNDLETLANSYHEDPKEWELFYAEFLRGYFHYPDLPALFVLYQGQRIAFVKFDPIEDFSSSVKKRRCCAVSINVAPALRGKGYGRTILEEVKPLIQRRGYEALYAEVKSGNLRSHRAFLSGGYRPLGEFNKVLEDGTVVPIVRYVADLPPLIRQPEKVFIIAEAGSNWRMGNLKRDLAMAKLLIHAAAEAGADAVKFQVFRPETIYVENAGTSGYLEKAGIGEEMKALFADLAMPYEMVAQLAAECQTCAIAFMATPFSERDFAAVDPYVRIHKIASYELNYTKLLELAARSQKPLLLSTGASTEEEIAWAIEAYHRFGGSHVTLLQCTACYNPAPAQSMHLNTLTWLKERFQVPVGLSDHSGDPLCAPLAAVALGASVIEKHLTLDRRLPGPDHTFAITPSELKQLVHCVRETEQMLGSYYKIVDPVETELRNFCKRGIQAIVDIKEGTVLRENENIAILRPGNRIFGLNPRFIRKVEGRCATRAIKLGDGIQYGDYR